MLFTSVECVRRITWKLTRASPTVFSRRLVLPRRTLSRDNGAPRSEGKTQADRLHRLRGIDLPFVNPLAEVGVVRSDTFRR